MRNAKARLYKLERFHFWYSAYPEQKRVTASMQMNRAAVQIAAKVTEL